LPSDCALLRVESCTFCGSDSDALGSALSDWTALGHEICATVVAIGAQSIANVRIDDLVAVELSTMCGNCPDCRGAMVDRCDRCLPLSLDCYGGFAEYIIVLSKALWTLPGKLRTIGSLVQPLAACIDVLHLAKIRTGSSVAIIGCGPIALMLCFLALRLGASRVECYARAGNDVRLGLANSMGAKTFVIPDDNTKWSSNVSDCTINTAPFSSIPSAVELTRYGGIVVNIGIGSGEQMTILDCQKFHWRRLTLASAFARPSLYFSEAISILQNHTETFEKFISHRFHLDQVEDAMKLLRQSKRSTVKVALTRED
jgi:threonine dehydrogenase-like Zn-dependent dehydrogenase